nr:immunoglobulin light chain junction region [Macaca mulatta]
CQKYSSSPCSF